MWIVAVAVVALLATAGLVSVAFYVGNPSEPPEQLGGVPQDPVMAKDLGSGEFEINAVPLEEFRDGNEGASRTPSKPVETFIRHDGDRTMSVVSQDGLVTLDNTSEGVEDYAMPGLNSNSETGLGLDEPVGSAVVVDKAQALFPDTGEASIPTLEPASSGHPADGFQTGPGTGVSASPAFTPTPKAPVDEVGETATQLGGNDADDQALIISEKRVLKYPNLGSHLNQLLTSVELGQATAEKAAEGAAIHQGESVAVTIHLSGECGRRGSVPGGQRRRPAQRGRGLYRSLRAGYPCWDRSRNGQVVIRVREIVRPEDG